MLGSVELPLALLLWAMIGLLGFIVVLFALAYVKAMASRMREERAMKMWDRTIKGRRG